MTENEAIEILRNNFPKTSKMVGGRLKGGFDDTECKFGKALLLSISALQELQQYRAIGTVSECQRAVEKMRGKEELLFTWDRICVMADRKSKDLARQEVGKLMVRNGETNPEETELPEDTKCFSEGEDAIKDFCDRYGVLFYGDGYIARVSIAMQQPAMTR